MSKRNRVLWVSWGALLVALLALLCLLWLLLRPVQVYAGGSTPPPVPPPVPPITTPAPDHSSVYAATVVTNSNIRECPSKGCPVMRVAAKGEVLIMDGRYQVGEWLRLINGGWIWCDLVEIKR